MIKAVILDIDDTLSLTEVVSFNIENKILKNMGQPTMSRKVHLETWETPPSKAIPIRAPGVDVTEFMLAYTEALDKCIESGKFDLIPKQNLAALDKLIEQGKQLMILSSRNHARIKHLLKPGSLLASRISAFYYRDNLEFRKPNPKVFDALLQQSGLKPAQCVYVGDSLRDAKAAKGAGLHFIASLESGLRQKKDFDGLPVDAFINQFPDIVQAVASLKF